jgi:hypothetical protein
VRRSGDQTGWSVRITYQDRGSGNQHTVPGNHTLSGTPPTYQPCAPSGFSATWGATRADGVTVDFGGDPGQVTGCSSFTYTLQKDGADCGDFGPTDTPPASTVIQPGCDLDSPGTWTVHVAWHDDNTGSDDALTPDIALGDPPGQ